MRSKVLGLALVLTACAGCSQTNIAELTKELAADPAANCIIVNAGPYGGITLARGTPNVSVSVSANGCNIEGAGVTKVTVPTQSISISPSK